MFLYVSNLYDKGTSSAEQDTGSDQNEVGHFNFAVVRSWRAKMRDIQITRERDWLFLMRGDDSLDIQLIRSDSGQTASSVSW